MWLLVMVRVQIIHQLQRSPNRPKRCGSARGLGCNADLSIEEGTSTPCTSPRNTPTCPASTQLTNRQVYATGQAYSFAYAVLILVLADHSHLIDHARLAANTRVLRVPFKSRYDGLMPVTVEPSAWL